MTSPRLAVLAALDNGSMSPGRIAAQLGVKTNTVWAAISRAGIRPKIRIKEWVLEGPRWSGVYEWGTAPDAKRPPLSERGRKRKETEVRKLLAEGTPTPKPMWQLLLEELKHGDLTRDEMFFLFRDRKQNAVLAGLRALVKRKLVHVPKWAPNTTGCSPCVKVYRAGKGPNVPRPPKNLAADRARKRSNASKYRAARKLKVATVFDLGSKP